VEVMKKNNDEQSQQRRAAHDLFFKKSFSEREVISEFIRLYLPKEIGEHADLKKLKLRDTSSIDDGQKESRADLLYEIEVDVSKEEKKKALIYLLFEHKSSPDRKVSLQLMKYAINILWHRATQNLEYCPIFPVVVYHGKVPWNVGRYMQDEYPPLSEETKEFFPNYQYHLIDLSQSNSMEIIGKDELKLVLLLMRYITGNITDQQLSEIHDLITNLEHSKKEGVARYVDAALTYIFKCGLNVKYKAVRERLEQESPLVGDTMKTIAEKMIARGVRKGWKGGREEGREEGRQEGRQEERKESLKQWIMSLLKVHFKITSGPLVKQVEIITDLKKLEAVKDLAETAADIKQLEVKMNELLKS
jgi:predicted transposase/invertase (TIGR01784 family)